MSPRPNAQQAEPTAMPSEQAPEAENTPPAAPNTPPPNTPRSMTRDAAMPQMAPQQPAPQPSAAGPKTSCKADSDCAAVDDTCGMCRCLALAKDAEPPACEGTKVQCIMAPCRGKRPVCTGGTCSLLDASSGAM